jgi:tetratricopeptide (TPR) repeat protein
MVLAGLVLGLALAGTQVWAWYHFRAAQEALRRYRLPEAQSHLGACLRFWPNHFQANLLTAQTARRLGDLEAAERQLARCQEIRGGFPEEIVIEQALLRTERGGMDATTSYLRPLVEANHPATPLILEAMARGYMKVYRFTDAGAVLQLWVERSPDDVQAHLLRGYVWEQLNLMQVAVSDYRRVVELDPDNEEGRLHLAALLLDLALPPEALEHLEYLIRKRPEDPDVLVRLARCRMARGQADEAGTLLEHVLQAHPRYRPALCARGELATQQNDPAEAEKWLREALALDPADFLTQYTLARSLRQRGKDDEARAVEERVAAMEKDINRMHAIVKEEIPRAPNDPVLLTEVGTILLRAGSEREGLQWLHKALQNDPAFPAAHRALAVYFERRGDAAQAAKHRRALGAAGTEDRGSRIEDGKERGSEEAPSTSSRPPVLGPRSSTKKAVLP